MSKPIPLLVICILLIVIPEYTHPNYQVASASFGTTSSSSAPTMKSLTPGRRLSSLSLFSNLRKSCQLVYRHEVKRNSFRAIIKPAGYAGDRQTSATASSTTTTTRRYLAAFKGDGTSNSSDLIRKTLASLTAPNADSYEAEQTIKKSRFIGLARHCSSWDDAQSFVSSVRDIHPKARHVCFGFVAGYDPVQERCSDDGEPTGTAGVPILSSIRGEDLSDTVCAVVRYSGGIKLGAGGLIRAYGGTARLVLRASTFETLIPTSSIQLRTPSSNAGQIYTTAAKFGGIVEGETYAANGDLEVTVVCESRLVEGLREGLRDATRGTVEFGDGV